jgi:endothelin-converting enzyme/putative endopeptidase
MLQRSSILLLLIPTLALAQYKPNFGESGIDLGALDTAVSPCTNFYQYACGAWRAQNPIPPDKSRWGRFDELAERNLGIERDILAKAAEPSPDRSQIDKEIGDFYAACMDEKSVDQKGVAGILPLLISIHHLESKDKLAAEFASLNREGLRGMFRFGAQPDQKNSSVEIADIDQGGLSLPDRDYYLNDNFKDIREKYVKHVANMFDLLSKSVDMQWDSQAQAATVMRIETELAKISMDRVLRRNPDNTYHPMTMADLPKLTPDFNWNAYFTEDGAPAFEKINVGNPEFFKGLGTLLANTSFDDLKIYLIWHVIHQTADALPQAYVDENFDFWGRTLNGQKELAPRWKRCVRADDRALGEALGEKFIQVAFSGPSKAKALELVHEIEQSMELDIRTAQWMTDATKKQAFEKLHKVSNKIGYPEHFRDYSSIEIKRDDYMGNEFRANAFEEHRDLNKIGKPVDKNEWGMTPPTVNAYYNPPENNINFPAGILQPPFYSAKADDAVNYGAIGVVVGHELTHGFDDQGRRYDGDGNLRDWWTPDDAKNFTEKAECIVNEYGSFSPVDGVTLNGKLTLGENAADNGGIHLAYAALIRDLADKVLPKKEDGFTQEQLFFLGYAQIWCQNVTDAQSRTSATVDPHSPGQFRVNGVVENLPEFQHAFSCKVGDPMVAPKACRVW